MKAQYATLGSGTSTKAFAVTTATGESKKVEREGTTTLLKI